MSEWLKWSQVRLLITLGISYLIWAEAVSLFLSDGATCIVNPAAYGAYYAENNECPALHVFLFKIAASVFEKLGDPNWVIALSAVITAFFTGILGYFTVSLARSTRIAANAAEKAVIEIERPWLFLEGATVRPRDPRTMTIIQNNWYIKLHWKNLGRSPAIVTDCIFKLIEFSTVGPEPDYTGALPLTLQRTIGVGESVPTNEVGPARKSTEGVEGPELIFFGRLTYSELNGKIHNTGFALRVAAAIPAYARYENKDYDYYD